VLLSKPFSRSRDRDAKGAEGVGVCGGMSPAHWGGGWEGLCLLSEKKLDFGSQCGEFWCILDVGQNELMCTRVWRPWSRDHNTAVIYKVVYRSTVFNKIHMTQIEKKWWISMEMCWNVETLIFKVAELTAETICHTDWCFKRLICSGWGSGLGLGLQFQLLSISEFRHTLTQSLYCLPLTFCVTKLISHVPRPWQWDQPIDSTQLKGNVSHSRLARTLIHCVLCVLQ